jgi:hypothetical protein
MQNPFCHILASVLHVLKLHLSQKSQNVPMARFLLSPLQRPHKRQHQLRIPWQHAFHKPRSFIAQPNVPHTPSGPPRRRCRTIRFLAGGRSLPSPPTGARAKRRPDWPRFVSCNAASSPPRESSLAPTRKASPGNAARRSNPQTSPSAGEVPVGTSQPSPESQGMPGTLFAPPLLLRLPPACRRLLSLGHPSPASNPLSTFYGSLLAFFCFLRLFYSRLSATCRQSPCRIYFS